MPAPVSNTNGIYNDESKYFVFRNLHYVPIVGFVSSLLAMLVPYAISVYLGDTPAILPFISDAGGDPPQSIVFGLFLGATSCTGLIGMYMKYLMVRQQNRHARDAMVDRVNRLSCVAGVIVCIGGFIVALSPTGHLRKDCTWYWPMFVPHVIGAIMIFGVGYTTTVLHIYLQYLTDARWKTSPVFYSRVLLSLVGIIAMLITGLNWLLFDMSLMTPPSGRGKVYPQGMLWAVSAEWAMAFIFQSYVLTYIPDFRKATFVLDISISEVRAKKE
ncbi:DNA damage-regulated autophagy modulator protein 1-like isoform X1 [Dermacentor albipictus]|uniref:DNA damage-regulated autophagy modulator protein 1-like isoform X1 n=1 Tax=Dermacentor albipictus TaxID=60249 RepID=UPI0031FBB917